MMDPTERKLLLLLTRILYERGTPAEQRKIDELLSKAGEPA
jgi:hypothetical protein